MALQATFFCSSTWRDREWPLSSLQMCVREEEGEEEGEESAESKDAGYSYLLERCSFSEHPFHTDRLKELFCAASKRL